jgi:hypothetical protein
MMPRKTKTKIIKAEAKLEASAKASFQRKKNITEVIPPDVTRAKAGAWLTLISPFTEWAGLRGDQIRHKRDLLRIQQETALTEIARLARQGLQQEGAVTTPVPNKFLIPFLERASLEEGDSSLCQRWADLLISAATTYDPGMVRFSAVLSEIGPGEVALLDRIVRRPRGSRGLHMIEDVPGVFVHGILPRFIGILFEQKNFNEEQLIEAIIDSYEYPGTVWAFLGVDDWTYGNEDWSEKEEAIASNLVSVGILHLLDGLDGYIDNHNWYGRVYALTSFGYRFIRACDRELHKELRQREIEFDAELAELKRAEKKDQ